MTESEEFEFRLRAEKERKPKYERPMDALDDPNMAVSGMGGLSRFGAGMGKAFSDLGAGGAQLVGFGPSAEEVVDQRKRDAALMGTGAGMAGNIAGNIVPAVAATVLAPLSLSTYAGAAGLGMLQGAMTPSVSPEEKLQSAGIGLATGLGGQAVANTVGRLLKPVQSTLGPEASRLSSLAEAEGIPLDVAQKTGSKPLQTVNAVFENLPFTAGPEAAKKATQQTAFNRAVLNRAGISADQATPDVLATQKGNLGKQFEGIAGRNSLDFNGQLTGKLANIASDAEQHLPPDAANKVTVTIDQILRQVDQGGVMSGNNYQGWRAPLNALAKKGDETSHFYSQVKKALDAEFAAQVPGADALAWKQISKEYANLKTISGAMGGAGIKPMEGNISPAQLAAAFTQSVGKEGKALGRGDLNDLVRVGQTFVRDQVPNSGTAQRAFYQNLMTGGVGAGLGVGGGMVAGQRDAGSLAQSAAMGAGAMYSPRLIQSILNSPAATKYLLGSNAPTSPEGRALVEAVKRAAVTAGISTPALANSRK